VNSKEQRDAFVAGWRACLDILADLDSHDHSTAEQVATCRYPEAEAKAAAPTEKENTNG
jgi:hypothetical protein